MGHTPVDRVIDAQERLRAARPRGTRSLPETLFMDVPDHKFDAEEYALAWSFVHYLIHREDGKHRKAFAKFLRETNGAGARPIPEIFKRATRVELKSLEGGWREYVLAMKRPPEVSRVQISVGGEIDPEVDLKRGDYVLSIDGCDIDDEAKFEQIWTKRKNKDKPVEWVVPRRAPVKGPLQYKDTLIRATVPANTKMVIEEDGAERRTHNIRD